MWPRNVFLGVAQAHHGFIDGDLDVHRILTNTATGNMTLSQHNLEKKIQIMLS